MPNIPNIPDPPGGGWRQQRAAELRAKAGGEWPLPDASAADELATEGSGWHTVFEGETLESIAADYDCSVEDIRTHPANVLLGECDGENNEPAAGDKIFIPGQDEQAPTPVGQGEHVVQQGECISSIAKDKGHFWETIWNDPGNSELRDVRQDPNVLLPEDRVTIPEKRRKEEPREAEQRHRFVRRGEPSKFRLVLHARGKPRANEPFRLETDNGTIEGTTDAEGKLEVPIPGNTKQGRLTVGAEGFESQYELDFGGLDPVTTSEGQYARLSNLGFVSESVPEDQRRAEALRHFQSANGLDETGTPDPKTLERLEKVHGY